MLRTPVRGLARRSAGVKVTPLEYPRLALYRNILRAHQKYLPASARELGDAYVKKEFHDHRGASAEFLGQFERQWRDYLTTLKLTSDDGKLGRTMTADEVAALSDEQKVQLLKIREGAQGPAQVDSS